MIPSTVRLYKPQGDERVAVVSVEPSQQQGEYLIRLGRGASSLRLTQGTTYGPYQEEDLGDPFEELVESLLGEGFLRSGLHALLAGLSDTHPAVRSQAAARMGWRRDVEAVQPLLDALPQAVDDTCAILDALGAIGDEHAIPVLREYAQRKLLSRRRSAVEALRNIDDEEGLAEAREHALQRLPDAVRTLLLSLDEQDDNATSVQSLLQIVRPLDHQQLGLTLDTLYELATPLPVRTVRLLLDQLPFDRAHLWRYIKSVFKRCMLRHDYVTFGQLAHTIEAQGRSTTGTTANVKSGYDGVMRQTHIFRQKTQDYLRRLAWRYLRRLAFHRPEAYPHAAAEALVPYTPRDADTPQDLSGPYASCYLFNRIIWGVSKRLTFDSRRMKFRFVGARAMQMPQNVREEAYPDLWDAQPRAYLRVLGAAKVPETHVFAVRALSIPRIRLAVLGTASPEEVLALLDAPYDPTVQLGLEELDQRFDAANPDWILLSRVLGDDRPIVRNMGQRWVRLSAAIWTQDPTRIVDFLTVSRGEMRALVVELARSALHQQVEVRRQLAMRLLVLLRQPESVPGAHEGYAQLARLALLEELDALLSLDEIVALVSAGTPAAQSVGGELLGRRPEAVGELGLEQLVTLAQHEVAAVRSAAHHLLRSAKDILCTDPSPLFVLVESDWTDTRELAFELLRAWIPPEALGLDGIVGLLDSNREDVRKVGRDLVLQHFASLPADELVFRLVQHPAAEMRAFTLDLVVQHLPPGVEPLRKLQGFFRAALFDLWPQRKVKHRILDFLVARGLQDEQQAEVVIEFLSDIVYVEGRAEFERALEGLVRLKLAYPHLANRVELKPGGVE